MLRKTKSILAILSAALILFSCINLTVFAAPAITVTDGEIVTLQTPNYTVKIAKNGFRYGFYRPDGAAFADMHATAGISFGKAGSTPYDAQSSVFNGLVGDTASFEVTNTNHEVADVSMKMFDHYVRFSIIPKGSTQSLLSTLPQTVVLGTSDTGSPGESDTAEGPLPGESSAGEENIAGMQADESSPNGTALGESENTEFGELFTTAQAGGYLHMLGDQDPLNATVYRLVTPGMPNDYTMEADVKIDAGSTKSVGIYAHYNASNAFHLFFIKAGTAGTGSIGLKRLGALTTVDLAPASITSEGNAITVQAGKWYHMKMVVQQKAIQCYLDGVLVFNAVDSGASNAEIQGGCGLRADKTGACFDNISVTSTDGATSYFGMDFESTDGIAGWQHAQWEKKLGSSSAEYVSAGGTVTAIPAYDPNSNTYLYIKPSDLNSVSVKELTDADIPDDNYTLESRVRFENAVAGTSSTGLFAHYNAPTAFHLFFAKSGGAYLKRLIVMGTSPTLGEKLMSSIEANKWYRMKLVASGTNLKCYLGGQLIFESNDTSASAAEILGGCGLRVYKDGASFDDIKVYSNANPLDIYYENDFEGKTLQDVSGDFAERLNLNAGVDISTVQLKTELRTDNPDAQLDNKYLLLTASPMSSAVITAGSAWSDYSVSADTSFTIGDEQTAASLLMRYADSQNYYRFGFLKFGYVSLIKAVGGVETVLQEVPFDFTYDKFYNLKAELSGQTITCFVDDTQVLTATDGTFAQGTAGVMANVTTAKVDNFTVTGGAAFADSFDGDLSAWALSGNAIISYDGDPAQNPSEPEHPVGNLFTIDARVEGNINPMYGLGDYGAVANTGSSVRDSSNVFGVNRTSAGSFTNKDGGPVRFISNFSIAPQRGFAQVLFEEADKRVVINQTQTMLGVLETEQVTTLYYFLGDVEQIYKDYRDVRNAEGYKDTKPHYEMFGLGWEAFGALGWNAYQANVMETVQDYLDEGYNITWAVIGSGFWTGDRSGLEGTTTSFGMWDDTYDPAGRNDTAQGMPNPRFPDPTGIKTFFKDRDIKLLLGLRVHLKLPDALGGDWNPLVDGNFVNEALDKGYFLKNRDGSLMKINAKYPAGNRTRKLTAYVDGSNPAAAEWYRQQAALWGVDGFKEDTMVLNGDRTYNDGNWNRLLSYMIEQDDSVMIMRNGAYSLSGDILRINDANMGTSNSSFNNSPDRMPINVLAYAASGVSNAYPDIVGGTGGTISNPTFQKYLVRNAQYAALNPSLSVGINALKMNNEEYKAATFNAINWHSTYAPYIYDAALKSWETGYPYSVTPLYIAYPEDAYTHNMVNTTEREYEWLLGESLLAAPQFGTDFVTADTRDVYLPEGKWIDYSTGESFDGPLLLENRAHPIENIPAFVGGKGVLVGEDMQNKGNYFVEVFPIANNGSTYDYTYIDGSTTSQIVNNNVGWSPATLKVRDTSSNKDVTFTYNTVNKSIKFAYEAGHNYELTGGEGTKALVATTAEVSKNRLALGQTAQLSVTSGENDDGTPADLREANYSYKTSDSGIVTVSSSGVITPVKEGGADVWASVTLNNAQGAPVTVDTNKLHIEVTKPTVAITSPIFSADDFSSGNINEWQDLAPEGSYSVQTIAGNSVLQYAGAGKSGDRGTLLKGDMTWQDYTVEADITIPSAPSGKTFGLTLRYNGANSCYVVGYTVGTGLRYIKRNGDGASPGVDSVSVPFTMNPGQTYHFKAVAKGNQFDLYVDDDPTPKLSVTDTAPVAPVYLNGPAGVYASGMDVAFDNFKVTTEFPSLPIEISGTSFGTDKVYLDVWNINTTVTPDVDGNWVYPITYIPNGDHTVVASVKDNTGKTLNSATTQFTVSGMPDVLNKTALKAAIDYADSKRPAAEQIGEYDGQYPQATVNTLAQAITQAQQVYDASTVQADIDAATDSLYAAVTAFEKTKVTIKRTALMNAISSAQGRMSGSYTAASKAQLQMAIDHAITVRDTVKVTQAEIDAETAELLNRITKLVPLPSSNHGDNNDSDTEDTSSASTSSSLIDQINTPSQDNTVVVNAVNGYDISASVFEALRQNPGKTLILNSGWYAWSFNGADIRASLSGQAGVDTRLTTSSPNAAAIAKLTRGTKTTNLHFIYEGNLPGRATLRIQLPQYAGKALFIYYFNPEKNRLELLSPDVVADRNGWFTFKISHCSDYVVSATPIEGAVIIPETGGGAETVQPMANSHGAYAVLIGVVLTAVAWSVQRIKRIS